MFKYFKMSVVSVVLIIVLSSTGSAFQLFGNTASSTNKPVTFSEKNDPDRSAAEPTPLQLGTRKPVPSGGSYIWIPGLGVVGKMPQLDFGLEMLYGTDGLDAGGQTELNNLDPAAGTPDSDFEIKGTIKRKF